MSLKDFLFNRESAVWLLLMALSIITWVIGASHSELVPDPDYGILLLLALAFYKCRLVIRYFMETRHAPLTLQLSCDAWVIGSFVAITGLLNGWFT